MTWLKSLPGLFYPFFYPDSFFFSLRRHPFFPHTLYRRHAARALERSRILTSPPERSFGLPALSCLPLLRAERACPLYEDLRLRCCDQRNQAWTCSIVSSWSIPFFCLQANLYCLFCLSQSTIFPFSSESSERLSSNPLSLPFFPFIPLQISSYFYQAVTDPILLPLQFVRTQVINLEDFPFGRSRSFPFDLNPRIQVI